MKFKKHLLNESSLGRILQHIKKENVDSWSILTSYRDSNKPSKNKKDFIDLKNKIRSMNLGFIIIKGVGQEEDGSGNIQSVDEPSIFIPDISKKQSQKLSDIYNQWGYIYSGIETNNNIKLISIEGEENIGKFHPNKISKFFSKIKGKPFAFESIEGNSYMERYWNTINEI